MLERPLSGKFVRAIHDRYIIHREKIGPPTRSISDPVLYPLEEKGIIGGFRDAWNTATALMDSKTIGSPTTLYGWRKPAATALFVSIAATEFAIIAMGADKIISFDKDGHPRVFGKHMDSVIERKSNNK